MSGRKSRSKGANAEREVAAIISSRLGVSMHRTPLSGGMSWKGDVQGWDGFHLEVKRQERLNLPAWIEQAEADCPDGSVPLVVHRRSREPWRVTMRLDDLLNLISDGAA